MSVSLHPAAPHHLPSFIPGPDGSDWLLTLAGVVLVGSVLAFGLVFLHIHTLPERMAHRGHKLQFEIVAVLGLLALFTHIHLFWVAALLLALVDIPDFSGPIRRIAGSAEKIANLPPGGGDTLEAPPDHTPALPALPSPSAHDVAAPRRNA